MRGWRSIAFKSTTTLASPATQPNAEMNSGLISASASSCCNSSVASLRPMATIASRCWDGSAATRSETAAAIASISGAHSRVVAASVCSISTPPCAA